MEAATCSTNNHIKRAYTFIEAMNIAGHGKFQHLALLIAGISSMTIALENHAMSFALPAAKCDLNISVTEQGFIYSVGLIGAILSSPFWGILTDTWGRQKTLRLTLSLTCLFSAMSSFSVTSWMLLLTRFFVGFFSAGAKISTIAFYDEFLNEKNRSKYLTFLSTFVALGFIIQPLIGLAIMTQDFQIYWFSSFSYTPWRLFTFVISFFAGITTIALTFLPEGPKYTFYAVGDNQETIRILQQIFQINTGYPKESYPVNEIKRDELANTNLRNTSNFCGAMELVWTQTSPLFKPPHITKTISVCAITLITFGVSQGIQLWYPQILTYYSGYTELSITTCKVIAMANGNGSIPIAIIGINDAKTCNISFDPITLFVPSILGLTFLTISIVVGFTMKIIGEQILLTSWLLITTLTSIALIWSNEFYINTGLTILTISIIQLGNIHASISSNLFPSKFKGMIIGLALMSGRIGSIFAANAVSRVLFNFCNKWFLANGIVLGISTVICYCIQRNKSQLTL